MQKTAVVTGGAGALGRSIVARLARDGFDVSISAVNADEKARFDGPAKCEVVDLTNLDATRAWAAKFSTLNALVLTAGGFAMSPLASAGSHDYDHMLDLNTRTAANCLMAFAKPLIDAGGASVVLVGSQSYPGSKDMAFYAAAKAAVVSMSRSAALEWQEHHVRVNAILPNTIDTQANRSAMPKANFDSWAEPDEIASVVAFLMSDESVLISGNAIALGRTL